MTTAIAIVSNNARGIATAIGRPVLRSKPRGDQRQVMLDVLLMLDPFEAAVVVGLGLGPGLHPLSDLAPGKVRQS